MISLGDRPGCGPRGAGPPGPNRDASHCGRNALQKSSTSQKTSTIRSSIIASVTERCRLPQKAFQSQSLNRAKTPYPGYEKIGVRHLKGWVPYRLTGTALRRLAGK